MKKLILFLAGVVCLAVSCEKVKPSGTFTYNGQTINNLAAMYYLDDNMQSYNFVFVPLDVKALLPTMEAYENGFGYYLVHHTEIDVCSIDIDASKLGKEWDYVAEQVGQCYVDWRINGTDNCVSSEEPTDKGKIKVCFDPASEKLTVDASFTTVNNSKELPVTLKYDGVAYRAPQYIWN